MGVCNSKTSTADTLLGGRVVGSSPAPFGVSFTDRLIDVPIGTVVCFDNGSKKKSVFAAMMEMDSQKLMSNVGAKLLDNILPRVGVIINELGVVKPVSHGNASVLDAIDLECISIVPGSDSVYVATASNGRTHVFKLYYTQPTCLDWGFLYAEHIAQGQLPSPPGAGEIESTAVFMNEFGKTMMLWTGRGGQFMKESWTRQAPFNYADGRVDETAIELGRFANVTGNPKFRTCSSLQVHVNGTLVDFWFTSVYDGMDADGKTLDPNSDQTSSEAKSVFKTVLAKTTFGRGPSFTDIIAQYEGIKVEAILLLVDHGDNKVKAVLLGSDDEQMGSLLGVQPLQEAKVAGMGDFGYNAGQPKFVNLAEMSMLETFIPASRFGTSGFAPAGLFAQAIINGGRV